MKVLSQIWGLIMSLSVLFEVGSHLSNVTPNALVKFTAIVDAISGKISGTVFARNKGGAYARGKGNPTNPQTEAQQAVRVIFTEIAQRWRSLVPSARAAWNAATNDYPYQNRLGNTRTLSGAGLHQKLNLNLASVNAAQLSVPLLPKALNLPNAFSVAVNDTAGTAIVSATFSTPAGARTSFAIFATESSSAGRTNLKNRLRKIAVVTADGLDNLDLQAAYVAEFGLPIVGANIGFELRPVQNQTGQDGAPFYTVSSVVA